MGGDGWDPYRRAFAQEDVWCPWSGREMRVLLTDEERVALGGKQNPGCPVLYILYMLQFTHDISYHVYCITCTIYYVEQWHPDKILS